MKHDAYRVSNWCQTAKPTNYQPKSLAKVTNSVPCWWSKEKLMLMHSNLLVFPPQIHELCRQ